MNVEANAAASENWEKLFKYIRERWYDGDVDLSDSKADLYDFANGILMRRMQERLVEVLQEVRSRQIVYLTFGNKFFMKMSEQQQRSFFHGIFNLPIWSIRVGEATDNTTESPEITIYTSALLEALPQLNKDVGRLTVINFALTCQSDVQALSKIILAKCKTLIPVSLKLESVECTVDDCNKQDSDESDGFLDPLFYAASGLHTFGVSTKTRSVESMLVSPRALRALFVEGKRLQILGLGGLGLTDSHILAIVDGLSTPGSHLHRLNLEWNLGITAQGYGTLLNLINRTNVYGGRCGHGWIGFCVDDKAWEGKLNLVAEMNSEYHRLEYLSSGTFTSEERRWQWLERVADLLSSDEDDEDDEHHRRLMEIRKNERDTKHLNFIWYTLRQNPEMMLISQAPTRMTRTRKRKAT
jgi:hypothetical protein